METTINPKQCCRYTYSVFPGMSIAQCFEANPWLFNKAFNLMAHYNESVSIPKNVFKVEKNWITENTVLFSGFSDNIEDYLGVMNWDDFGTWYIYLFPNELKIDDPLCIGLSTFLPKSKGMDLVDYHYLGREW